MKQYILTPNLPKNTVNTVILSGEISPESEYILNEYGICCIKTPQNAALYNSVAYHADMVMHHIGGSVIICEPSFCKCLEALTPIPNVRLGNKISEKYPLDIAYNAARVGKYLICNEKYTQGQIIQYCRNNGITIINVKQGYAKCSVCIIDEHSIITSDAGIAAAVKRYDIDVLFTDDCGVKLKGLNHGFFGGATGKISPDKLAVNGNIKYHKCCNEIKAFAGKRGVEIVSLNTNDIEDIGSILPILEKASI